MLIPGRFRWAFLQLGRLKTLRPLIPVGINKVLADLPKTLDESYERILSHDIQDIYRSTAFSILRWLTLAYQPLLIEELIDACAISLENGGRFFEDERLNALSLLDMVPNLVTIDPEVDLQATEPPRNVHYVSLSHFSVKEYLVGASILSSAASMFAVNAKLHHATRPDAV